MTVDVAVWNTFGGDEWNAEAYKSLSVASSVSALLRSNALPLNLLWQLRNLNKTLDDFFKEIREVMEGKNKVPVQPNDTPIAERVETTRTRLKELDEVLSRVYRQAKRAGLTNRTFMALQYARLREHIDEVQDLREWLDLYSNPAHVDELFARAERESQYERPIDLSKVR